MFTATPLSATKPAIPVPQATRTSSRRSISAIVLRGHTSNSFDTRHLRKTRSKTTENYFSALKRFSRSFLDKQKFDWQSKSVKSLKSSKFDFFPIFLQSFASLQSFEGTFFLLLKASKETFLTSQSFVRNFCQFSKLWNTFRIFFTGTEVKT